MKFPSSEPQDLLTKHLLDHLHALGFVGVGIGKTAASLSAVNKLFQRKQTIGTLVLAPMRVANLTWPLEVERWDDFKWMKVANLRSPAGKRAFLQGKAHIYVCNYESIPKLVELVKTRRSLGLGLPYDTLIIDESTKLKNPTSKRANLYRREIQHSDHQRIWALTGTPAPNSLLDLFAQARFVDNGKRLGRAYEHFKQTYFKQTGYGGYKWKELPGSNEAIENRLADITLTLRSKDWLNLPETVVEDVEVQLPKNLIHDYKEFEKELVLQLKSAEITAPNAAALVAKLLQFTSGSIYDADSKWHDIHDLKIKALEKIIKQTEGPVLVACAFRHEQERLRKYFPKAKFFADAKNQTSQKQLLEDWNNKKIPILVAHPKSVGHGLNLQHGGNTLVWLTLTYSREDYEQMIARLDRRGQDTVVTVYRILCPDTVDYAVASVIEEKKMVEDRLLTALQLLESYREGAVPRKKLTIKHEEDFC